MLSGRQTEAVTTANIKPNQITADGRRRQHGNNDIDVIPALTYIHRRHIRYACLTIMYHFQMTALQSFPRVFNI